MQAISLSLIPPPPTQTPAEAHVLAFSGGLDSTVLLHLALKAGLGGLRAVHIHHGLQPDADAWARHCAAICAEWQVPFKAISVVVDAAHPKGPEAAARAVRYAALASELRKREWLLTAHHQRDQAETLLLRLLRGAGVDGMAAMPAFAAFAEGHLWRPLLERPRAELEAYARAHGLLWIDDPQNNDLRFTRSWLRAEVMPGLRARVPAVDALLARAASHAREASLTLATLAAEDLRLVTGQGEALCCSALRRLPRGRADAVLRLWLQQKSLPPAASSTFDQIHREVLQARTDATPLLAWPGGEFRRYRDLLFASHRLAPPPAPEWSASWLPEAPLQLPPGCGSLSSLPTAPSPASAAGALLVRFAKGGESIRPAGSAHHKTLKQLAQQAGIPPWVRQRMPMIYRGETLVSVAGCFNAESAPPIAWQVADLPGIPGVNRL